MRNYNLGQYFVIATLLVSSAVSLPTTAEPAASSSASVPQSPEQIIQDAQARYETNTFTFLDSKTTTSPKCTRSNVSIRRAWDALSLDERQAYTKAAQCLTTIPSRIPSDLVPGALSLHDDFVWGHINQTNFIHASALLLPWHRQFLWGYEQALRSECNYTGALPYWNWEDYTDNQVDHPIFAPNTDASFGSNGVFVANRSVFVSTTIGFEPPFVVDHPPATGGGCITDGPFSNLSAHLGPVSPDNSPDNLYGKDLNPRCVVRDFNPDVSTVNLTKADIAALYQTPTIHEFHPQLELGVHIHSHAFVGGQQNDLYCSPNDPIFYAIHTQLDRIWSVWQAQDYESRLYALDGTLTLLDRPPTANGTVTDIMYMGVAGGDLPIGDAMGTVLGEYCYMYA